MNYPMNDTLIAKKESSLIVPLIPAPRHVKLAHGLDKDSEHIYMLADYDKQITASFLQRKESLLTSDNMDQMLSVLQPTPTNTSSDDLTDALIARIARPCSHSIEKIAINYLGLNIETLENFQQQSRADIQAISHNIIRMWRNTDSANNSRKKLAGLLYKAAEETGAIMTTEIEKILGISQAEAASSANQPGSNPSHPSAKTVSIPPNIGLTDAIFAQLVENISPETIRLIAIIYLNISCEEINSTLYGHCSNQRQHLVKLLTGWKNKSSDNSAEMLAAVLYQWPEVNPSKIQSILGVSEEEAQRVGLPVPSPSPHGRVTDAMCARLALALPSEIIKLIAVTNLDIKLTTIACAHSDAIWRSVELLNIWKDRGPDNSAKVLAAVLYQWPGEGNPSKIQSILGVSEEEARHVGLPVPSPSAHGGVTDAMCAQLALALPAEAIKLIAITDLDIAWPTIESAHCDAMRSVKPLNIEQPEIEIAHYGAIWGSIELLTIWKNKNFYSSPEMLAAVLYQWSGVNPSKIQSILGVSEEEAQRVGLPVPSPSPHGRVTDAMCARLALALPAKIIKLIAVTDLDIKGLEIKDIDYKAMRSVTLLNMEQPEIESANYNAIWCSIGLLNMWKNQDVYHSPKMLAAILYQWEKVNPDQIQSILGVSKKEAQRVDLPVPGPSAHGR